MQSTMGSPAGEEDHFGVPLLTIMSGLALAVAAVFGLGGPPDLSSGGHGSSQTAIEAVEVRPAQPSRLLVYLVASEERRRAIQQEIATDREWFIEAYAAGDAAVRVLVLVPAAEESLETLAQLLPEAALGAGQGPEIKLVDMR
jgi:hypothetical protein